MGAFLSVDDLELFLEYTRRRHREAVAGASHGAGTGGGTPRAGAGTGGGTPRAGAGAGLPHGAGGGGEVVGGRTGGPPRAGCAAGTPSAGAPPGGAGAGTTGGAWCCSDSCSDDSEVDAWELAIGDKHGVAVVDG